VDPLENLVALDYCRQLYIIDSQKVTMVEEKTEKKERKLLKSKSFKRMRSFLKGSKKKKKDDKEQNNATRSIGGDEESTIYVVDVDERSVISRQTNDAKAIFSILDAANADGKEKKSFLLKLKVVLLLMDLDTRRFELLQLEFDSLKALVSDVLAQIPVTVTEEALCKQTYTGICGSDGKEMAEAKLLAEFCQGNEVLVAIPTGIPAKECARLARPILSDEKVVARVCLLC
jgi:hypothetical protein